MNEKFDKIEKELSYLKQLQQGDKDNNSSAVARIQSTDCMSGNKQHKND